MSAMDRLGLALCAAIVLYLLIALLLPEKFH